MANPAAGILLASLGIVTPPELRQNVVPRAVTSDVTASRSATAREARELLEDRTQFLALARAVIAAAQPNLPARSDEWDYSFLASNAPFSRTGVVIASERAQTCSPNIDGCDGFNQDPLTLWITIERLSRGALAGHVALASGSSHDRTRRWTFTAAADTLRWVVRVTATQ